MKKWRLNNNEEIDDEESEGVDTNSTNQIQKQGKLSFKSKLKLATSGSHTHGVQSTINQCYKKGVDKEEIDALFAEFFYTSVIPFNVIKIQFCQNCEKIGRYEIRYRPPSYHDLR